MSGKMEHRLQRLRKNGVCMTRHGQHPAPVSRPIGTQAPGSLFQGVMETHGVCSQRMRQCDFRMNPFEARFPERQASKEGRAYSEWMNCRAHIVDEAGKRDFGGAKASSDRFRSLENLHAQSRLSQRDRGGKPIGAGAHDDGSVRGICSHGMVEERFAGAALEGCYHGLFAKPKRASQEGSRQEKCELSF
jgi:hypothetical protein